MISFCSPAGLEVDGEHGLLYELLRLRVPELVVDGLVDRVRVPAGRAEDLFPERARALL